MKSLEQQLSQYAAYHRDGRNIATHFVGIPMIVLAVDVLLSRPVLNLAGLPVSLALAAAVVTSMFYLLLDVPLGTLTAVLMGLGVWFGAWAADQTTAVWLSLGLGGFVVGWAFQFVGHAWEGRKPAFVDDLMGLAIGPLFVVTEAIFLMGLRSALRHRIEAQAGPIRRRDVNSKSLAEPGP